MLDLGDILKVKYIKIHQIQTHARNNLKKIKEKDAFENKVAIKPSRRSKWRLIEAGWRDGHRVNARCPRAQLYCN